MEKTPAIENRICEMCKQPYISKTSRQKTCSYICGYRLQNTKKRRGITNFGYCARCGKSLRHKKSHAIYCSKTCKSMDHNFKHRSKTRLQGIARRREIFERDNGICYMCKKVILFNETEIDHLIPVAHGGSSHESNLAISCRSCNRKRGIRMEEAQFIKLNSLGVNFDY